MFGVGICLMRALTDGRLQADMFQKEEQTVTSPSILREISVRISPFCKAIFGYSERMRILSLPVTQGRGLTMFPGTLGDICALSYRSGWSCLFQGSTWNPCLLVLEFRASVTFRGSLRLRLSAVKEGDSSFSQPVVWDRNFPYGQSGQAF